MSIKALVAVRSGSVRVKNIRPFAGSSLLEIKLMQLKKISGLDGIVVNSNEVCLKRISRSITSWRISPAVRIYRTLIINGFCVCRVYVSPVERNGNRTLSAANRNNLLV